MSIRINNPPSVGSSTNPTWLILDTGTTLTIPTKQVQIVTHRIIGNGTAQIVGVGVATFFGVR